MEKKVFGSRISVLVIGLLLLPLVPLFMLTFYNKDILSACILGGVLLFGVLLFCGIRYIISGNKLYIKMCWIIPFGSLNVTDIISVRRSYNLISSPAASLKRLLVCTNNGSSFLISPICEQEFCGILKKINSNINVCVNDKKTRCNIRDWDIPTGGTMHQTDQAATDIQAVSITSKSSKLYRIHIFTAIVVIIPIIIFYLAYREPQVVIDLNTFNLKGMYGMSVPLSEITEIDIIDLHEIPAVSIRTNGISFLNVQRGNFRTVDGKNIRMNIHRGINRVIKIVNTRNEVYYINRKNADETKEIFNTISRRIYSENQTIQDSTNTP